jgi:preprotein translocase subunit SecF
MFVVKHRSFFFWLTGLLLVGSIAALVIVPPTLSIEFTGGSLVEVSYTDTRPELHELKEEVENLALGEVSLRESGENGVTLRTRSLSPEEHTTLLGALSMNETHPLTELRFNSIGPSLGKELAIKALYAIGAVVLAIMLYIAFVFRKVSRPVPAWGYGVTAVAMLMIDIIVPSGFFAVYAYFTGAQVDTLFVIALLALLGYCINDVIVIFDRVREHLRLNEEQKIEEDFEVTIGKSITETLGRSINTAVTVALALIALIVVGSEATRTFAIVMLVGVIAGTFSSICRSAPLLIPIAQKFGKPIEEVKKK